MDRGDVMTDLACLLVGSLNERKRLVGVEECHDVRLKKTTLAQKTV